MRCGWGKRTTPIAGRGRVHAPCGPRSTDLIDLSVRCGLSRTPAGACNTELCSFTSMTSQPKSPGAHAILVLDQGGWHGAKALKVSSSISLLQLPPRAYLAIHAAELELNSKT